MVAFKFGSFDYICATAALQPAVCFVHIVALIMTAIMIFHIRSKYTAVGRKEIVMFFYIYAFIELLSIFVDSGIIPSSNKVYPWFAAIHVGAICALFWCLVVNGFVGFQFAEDGTPMSLWFLRVTSLVVFGVALFVSVATFNGYASFSYTKPMGLFIIELLFPLICVVVYVISQLILVLGTLEDRWIIGDIVFGLGFFGAGCILLFAFGIRVCDAVQHYIDGLFFFCLCMLLSVMMVYKYWDSITKEDLEFAVGDKGSVWEVKDPGLYAPAPDFADEDQSAYRGGGGSLVGGISGTQRYNNNGSPNGGSYGYPPAPTITKSYGSYGSSNSNSRY